MMENKDSCFRVAQSIPDIIPEGCFDFAEALERMRAGKKVSRVKWDSCDYSEIECIYIDLDDGKIYQRLRDYGDERCTTPCFHECAVAKDWYEVEE